MISPNRNQWLDSIKADTSVVSVLDLPYALDGDIKADLPLSRWLILSKNHEDYSRILERTDQGVIEQIRIPVRDFIRQLKQQPKGRIQELSQASVLYHTRDNFHVMTERASRKKQGVESTYSTDVRYLAYRKIYRIFEDGKKQLSSGDVTGAQLLLAICLSHLVRYQYVHENVPIPAIGKIVTDLNKSSSPISSLLLRFPKQTGLVEAYNQMETLLDGYEQDYPWPMWCWESDALRFGRGFTFEGLVFRQSNSLIWRVRDWFLPKPPTVLPRFLELERSVAKAGRLGDIKAEIVRVLKSIPSIEGALIFGSKAKTDLPVEQIRGEDIDLVIFTRGFYLKRFFLDFSKIKIDGIVLSSKVADLAVRHHADMAINGFANGEIIYDKHNRFSELVDIAATRFPQGAPQVPAGDLQYALLRLQIICDVLNASNDAIGAGIRFFLLENFIHVLYLLSRAKGLWFIGEQRILPGLEEKAPAFVRGVEKCLEMFGDNPEPALHLFYQHVCQCIGGEEPPRRAESRERFSVESVFDL